MCLDYWTLKVISNPEPSFTVTVGGLCHKTFLAVQWIQQKECRFHVVMQIPARSV